MGMKYDCGGYASRYNIPCTDGCTIAHGAFAHMDGMCVPVVWEHRHEGPCYTIGKAVIEHKDDGPYAYLSFNDTERGRDAKEAVLHGDMSKLSIYANNVRRKGDHVTHGDIVEVSLVYAAANAGAYIDNISIAHGDSEYGTEVVIYSHDDLDIIEHEDKSEDKKPTFGEILDTMNKEQRDAVDRLVEIAYIEGVNDTKDDKDDVDEKAEKKDIEHSDKMEGDTEMKKNAFDKSSGNNDTIQHGFASAENREVLFADAKRCGSLKDAFLQHAATYGIQDINKFFPDAKLINEPEFIKEDDTWVGSFLGGATHSPFAKIKSLYADITKDEARAKGYAKGSKKVEEVIIALNRETAPTTVYKKQKLDRDDIIDIRDFNVVSWLKKEMRIKLNEEVAMAGLISDGRDKLHPDKIKEDCIRPIYGDDETFAVKVIVELGANDGPKERAIKFIDAVIRNRKKYKGSGAPIMYLTEDLLSDILLLKDEIGHRLYKTEEEIATALRSKAVFSVPQMEARSRKEGNDTYELAAINVNPRDYTFGTDRGGEINFFDDFDLNYNQELYLLETRTSGALMKPSSALVIEFKTTESVSG